MSHVRKCTECKKQFVSKKKTSKLCRACKEKRSLALVPINKVGQAQQQQLVVKEHGNSNSRALTQFTPPKEFVGLSHVAQQIINNPPPKGQQLAAYEVEYTKKQNGDQTLIFRQTYTPKPSFKAGLISAFTCWLTGKSPAAS